VAFLTQFFDLVDEVLQFGRNLGVLRINKGWRDTNLTQSSERGEGDDAGLLGGLVYESGEHFLAHLAHGAGVEALLLLAQFQLHVACDFGRQFLVLHTDTTRRCSRCH
jgi:hypothetical protein